MSAAVSERPTCAVDAGNIVRCAMRHQCLRAQADVGGAQARSAV